MQKKTTTLATKKPRKEEEKPENFQLVKTDFKVLKFSHTQLQFFKTIKKNFLTVCTGPAGCLTKNEKVRGYIFRSKKMTRNIHEEKPGEEQNPSAII